VSDGPSAEARATHECVLGMRDEFIDFLAHLCSVESPTDHPDSQTGVHAILVPVLEDLGYDVRIVRGRRSGNHLLAVPRGRRRRGPTQLLMGHSDTVWPVGTLAAMPVHETEGRLHGPGTLDMKGGLAQMVFALRALRTLQYDTEVAPVLFINSDEEVGSPDSRPNVCRLARQAERAFVLEPAAGPSGKLKTARKGLGSFDIFVTGRAAHAGLDPGAGASAIVELAHVIHQLDALNDLERGTTVNVGTISGGTRPNVVAAQATAAVDVRVTSMEDGAHVEEAVRSIRPMTPGVTLSIQGGVRVAPLERTPRNRALWRAAVQVGAELGFRLEEAMVGGGSDGNTTSLFTATLDGLGCVGDGAHADHEHIEIEPSLDRCALLARLLLMPADGARRGGEHVP
jgi:glutamate carboxypeptidase